MSLDALDRRAVDRAPEPDRRRIERSLSASVRCPSCHESGEVWHGSGGDHLAPERCLRCRGTGRVKEYRDEQEQRRAARHVARVIGGAA